VGVARRASYQIAPPELSRSVQAFGVKMMDYVEILVVIVVMAAIFVSLWLSR
jgi:hypothetical protein